MVDDERSADDAPEGPRRKTYTPPDADAVFTGSFPVIEDDDAPSPTIAPPIAPAAPTVRAATEPPVRTSLSDQAIIDRFASGEAGSTAQMMAELEAQVELREAEEEAFEMWANLTRATRGAAAEAIIARERLIFDGGTPDDDEEEAEAEPDEESVDANVAQDDAAHDDTAPDDAAQASADDEQPEAEAEVDSELPEEASEEAETRDEELADAIANQWPINQSEGDADDSPVVEESESPTTAGKDSSDLPSATTAGLAWLWAAVAAPVVGLVGGGFLVSRGLGLLEALVALAVPALMVGLSVGFMASRGAGTSSLNLGRTTFGHAANAPVALVLTLARIALAAVLLVGAVGVASRVVALASLWPYPTWVLTASLGAVVAVAAAVLAVWGGAVLRVALWSSAAISGLGLVSLVLWLTLGHGVALIPAAVGWDTPWVTVSALSAVVLSALILVVGLGASDLVDLRPGSGRAPVGLSSALGSIIPLLVVIGVGLLLAGGNPGLAITLVTDPVGSIIAGMPAWYPAPVIVALALPLVGLSALVLHGAGRGADAVAPAIPRRAATAGIAVIATGLAAVALAFGVSLVAYIPDVLLSLGVVLAAWIGAVAKDIGVRGETSVEPAPVRIGVVLGFVVSIAIGLGLVTSRIEWLSWQGYLFPVLEQLGVVDLSRSGIGVWVALVLSALVAFFSAVYHRRRARVDA